MRRSPRKLPSLPDLPRHRGLRRGLAAGLAAALATLLAAPPSPAAEANDVFRVIPLRSRGRPVHVTAVPPGPGARGAGILVVRCEGTPPQERRRLDLFRLDGPPPADGLVPKLSFPVPPDVVAFDVADVDPAPGPELLLFSRSAIEIRTLRPPASLFLRRIDLDPPAPFPPRLRSLTPLETVDDWGGEGPAALLPSLEGVRVVPLRGGGEPRTLKVPILADYYTRQQGPPIFSSLLQAVFEWPNVVAGDDDGDGRDDVFALGRYGVEVFRNNGHGLPETPDRVMPLRPFSRDEELRYQTTEAHLYARDLDGDGLTDLVVHLSTGRLTGSRSSTLIYRNPGDGADLARAADASLHVESGVADVNLVDLDGDGRVELLHRVLRFGVLQLIRFLTTRRAEVELRVFRLPGPGIHDAEETWHENVSVAVDFSEGRVAGLLPNADGDWNGDGRRDLLYGIGRDEIGIHLGIAGKRGPAFGERAARQKIPPASWMVALDADGDRLDDAVIYDDWKEENGLFLLQNRGILPGTSPSLRPVP